jgi:predicted Zn-dependent protease
MGDMQQRLLIQQHMAKFSPQNEPSLQHAMMSARARVLAEPGIDVLRLWAAEPQASGFGNLSKARQVSGLYAALLANIKLRDFNLASSQKDRLNSAVAGNLIALKATKLIAIELHLVTNNVDAALALLPIQAAGQQTAGLRLSRPELFAQSAVQIASKDIKLANQAAQDLQTWVAKNPTDAPAWQQLGRAYQAIGQNLRAVRAEAEAQVALLDYAAAIDRFKAAQDMVRNGSASTNTARDYMEESIIDVQTRQVQELLRLQLKDEKEAAK